MFYNYLLKVYIPMAGLSTICMQCEFFCMFGQYEFFRNIFPYANKSTIYFNIIP